VVLRSQGSEVGVVVDVADVFDGAFPDGAVLGQVAGDTGRSAAGVVREAHCAASAPGSVNRTGRKESNSCQADQMSRRTASATAWAAWRT